MKKLLLLTLASILGFWLLFYLNIPKHFGYPNTSLLTIFANYDGTNYLAISKCNYDLTCIRTHFSLPLPVEYYPAHFPGFPVLIKILDQFTTGPKAMLLANLLGSLVLCIYFYKFAQQHVNQKVALWLSVVFIFLPARLFVLRLVGAPETWFIAAVLASLYHFEKRQYLFSALFLALAQFLKTPAILLFGAYFLFLLKTCKTKKIFIQTFLPFLLAPLVILAVFYYYQLQTGDFLAYFHSGDNHHLNLRPFAAFNKSDRWVGDFWLEDIIYVYFLVGAGMIAFIKNQERLSPSSIFAVLYFLANLTLNHRDVSRYISPLYPLALIGLSPYLMKKEFKILFVLLLPAIFLYSINFVIGNTTPIADWSPYF